MSGGFPPDFSVANSNGAGVSSGAGVTITGAAAAYGSYVQLIASTPYDTSWLLLSYAVTSNSSTNNSYITLGIGAGGSEVAIISDYYTGFDGYGVIEFPIQIPAGTRIAAKFYSDGGTDTAKVAVVLFDTNLSSQEAYAGAQAVAGAPPSISGNVASGTSGTYGSWVQMVASTSRDYTGLIPILAGTSGNTVPATLVYEIGIGAGGSELPIVVDLLNTIIASNRSVNRGQFIPLSVPSGSRLSVRTTVPGGSPLNSRLSCLGVY